MAGSVLIWAPPGRGRRVPGARNGAFWPPKNPGACFWGRKKTLREWPHAIPRFSIETGLLGGRKTQGRVFWGRKKPLREWGHAIPRFSIRTAYFSRRKTQGRVFGGGKSPCGKHADSHPGFGQGPVSNPASPGCVVRVPAHWAS